MRFIPTSGPRNEFETASKALLACNDDEDGAGAVCDGLEGAASEIEAAFRRRLSGLRGLSPQQRAATLRAARDWRHGAHRVLQDKRREARRIRWELHRLCRTSWD